MIPVEVLPPNVACAGPIIRSGPPADLQDPGTATWLKKAPTVLFNLSSNLAYDKSPAEVMAIAIAALLSSTDYQVLWKFNKLGYFSDNFLVHLKPYLENERLKMPSWLVADPASLLDTGNIVTSVHHGGSNCFHEALVRCHASCTFLWADLYNYAALAETRGIGVWGCRDSTPNWTSECLLDAFMKGIDGCGESFLQRRAKWLGDRIKAGKKGRDVAADEIAKLAYLKSSEGSP
ncbi:2-hydroxyacylsphingosine 1-beta-galactosyltransferase [Fusarium tjaetaba]|uniref:2-hydroxyacylsphingosine 1-beta-galactosyltransferase n=1 Tax=Fusarium tjaetaba TaxID=1567544 RepID=A0A8H5S9Q2_9HYPO|nr:2-hydroxyacylsphingosine 1-beta-galactosyltransferase [Fusarium tjaetaba]KAF5649121.1 2-hydroxyacylsphingosine 1-beta-galactosyltransferase [Fusarium tjaetaba]